MQSLATKLHQKHDDTSLFRKDIIELNETKFGKNFNKPDDIFGVVSSKCMATLIIFAHAFWKYDFISFYFCLINLQVSN